ncbi:MAG: YcxB family protein [Candidatus Sulfotelmatobacter sp.]
MNNPALNLTFRYSESDYVRAMRAHYADYLRLRRDISVAVVVGIVRFWLWPSLSGKAFLGVSAAFILILLAAFFIMPRLAFRRELKFRDEYSLTFSQDGIHFRTAHIDSNLAWELYSRALVDAQSYVLYYGPRTFTVIPKRVFQNAEQQAAFDQLVTQHVPVIVRKK